MKCDHMGKTGLFTREEDLLVPGVDGGEVPAQADAIGLGVVPGSARRVLAVARGSGRVVLPPGVAHV